MLSTSCDSAGSSSGFSQPLVSVIVSNYNYAKYIESCLASVFRQTYPNIECIIVDDASKDDSASIIDTAALNHPDLIVLKRTENGGQSAAILDGLAAASGQFVVMLDADDALLPNAIASHVYVHQSIRLPIGFTCADMLQLADDVLISSAAQALNQYVMKNRDARFESRRGLENLVRRPSDVDSEILNNTYVVGTNYRAWAWSATSAIMFRRDALRIWEKTPGLKDLRYSTDAFFCYGINAICGSAVIDLPLTAYRMHGKNGFAARLPLHGIRNYDIGSDRSLDALRLLIVEAKTNPTYRSLFWHSKEYRVMNAYLRVCFRNIRLNNLRNKAFASWF